MAAELRLLRQRLDGIDGIQTMTTLALKCAAGSRQSITALAELRALKKAVNAMLRAPSSGL